MQGVIEKIIEANQILQDAGHLAELLLLPNGDWRSSIAYFKEPAVLALSRRYPGIQKRAAKRAQIDPVRAQLMNGDIFPQLRVNIDFMRRREKY